MKNIIILGSGRSGTSMTGGLFSESGYFMGNKLIPPRDANPKGFYEDREINDLNEEILDTYLPSRPKIRFFGRFIFRERFFHSQKWLARVPLEAEMHAPPKTKKKIKNILDNQPYCFKDPRFSYTYDIWRPYLLNVVNICVFRHPLVTARSVLKEVQKVDHLRKKVKMNVSIALEMWKLMHLHILEKHSKEGDWLFVHFDQILNGTAFDDLEKFTGAEVDKSFPDPNFKRSKKIDTKLDEKIEKIYLRLCERAGYEE